MCSVFRVTPKTILFISSVYFAIEEINRDIHILPNISLQVQVECNLMLDHMKGYLYLKRKEIVPNYYCKNQRRYLIVLTAPLWITSYKFGPILYFSRTPEVSPKGVYLMKDYLTTVCVSQCQE